MALKLNKQEYKLPLSDIEKSSRATRVLSLQNGWQHYGSSWGNATIERCMNIVSLHGMVKGGTVTSRTIITNIPVDLRPKRAMTFSVASSAGNAKISCFPSGNVQIEGGIANNDYLSLSGATWFI